MIQVKMYFEVTFLQDVSNIMMCYVIDCYWKLFIMAVIGHLLLSEVVPEYFYIPDEGHIRSETLLI